MGLGVGEAARVAVATGWEAVREGEIAVQVGGQGVVVRVGRGVRVGVGVSAASTVVRVLVAEGSVLGLSVAEAVREIVGLGVRVFVGCGVWLGGEVGEGVKVGVGSTVGEGVRVGVFVGSTPPVLTITGSENSEKEFMSIDSSRYSYTVPCSTVVSR